MYCNKIYAALPAAGGFHPDSLFILRIIFRNPADIYFICSRKHIFLKQNETIMAINWLAVLVAAFVPTVMGFIWYNPKLFGPAWMKAAEMTEEKRAKANTPLVYAVSFIVSLLLAFSMNMIAYHQTFVANSLMNQPGWGDPNSEVGKYLADYMAKYGTNYRTFSHGFSHGMLIAGLLVTLPVLTSNALFEGKSFKYIAINVGYWLITLGLMGGIVAAWM
jgi:hypothetical protein